MTFGRLFATETNILSSHICRRSYRAACERSEWNSRHARQHTGRANGVLLVVHVHGPGQQCDQRYYDRYIPDGFAVSFKFGV